MDPAETELREFTRVATALPVRLRWAAGTVAGRSRDVSLAGILVQCPAPPTVGAAVAIEIDLGPAPADSGEAPADSGEAPAIRATGTVVRTLSGPAPACAIRIDELHGEASFHHLRSLVLYNARDPARVEREFAAHVGLRPE